ncbi:hypothetical protein F9L33_00145 [Amylibacter sp. SFDW26]|uniref:hypothetical protein n=1 Tax=Amylibacter sp. SFDW26 TaxID=2652722 RepID=UPI001261CB6F|nr:hypothetical protein [Amylibacter sp. SFDW26]KAB7615217.1 hypothetical protein F9L33_00145 [Amylibacter sp. SFDW26]
MGFIFGGLLVIFFWIMRASIPHIWRALRNTHWLKFRKEDVFLSLGVFALICGVEYVSPSLGLTGLERPEKPENVFYSEQKKWADKAISNDEISKLAPWLGAFGQVTKTEYKEQLSKQLIETNIKISKESENIRAQEKVVDKLSPKNGGVNTTDPQTKSKTQLSYYTHQSILAGMISRIDRLNIDKSDILDRQENIDSLFGEASELQYYELQKRDLEQAVERQSKLVTAQNKIRFNAQTALNKYQIANPGSANDPDTRDERDRLEEVSTDEGRKYYGLNSKLRVIKSSLSGARRMSEGTISSDIFPVLDKPIEILDIKQTKRFREDTKVGPTVEWNFSNNKLFNAFQNKLRNYHDHEQAIKCHVLVDEENGNLNASRGCEIILPININYDLTKPQCNAIYSKTNLPYRVDQKPKRGEAAVTHCIERWKFPTLRLVIKNNQLTVYEPASDAAPLDHVHKHGSPISRWEIYWGGEFKRLDREFTGIWPSNKQEFSIRLRHLPKDDSFASDVNAEAKLGGVRIWEDFDTSHNGREKTSRVVGGDFYDAHLFEKTGTKIGMKLPFVRDVNVHLYDDTQDVSKSSKVITNSYANRLRRRMRTFDQVSFTEYQRAQEEAAILLDTSKTGCHFPVGLNRNVSTSRHVIAKSEIKSLMELVDTNDEGIDCRKYHAIRTVLDSLILFYEGKLYNVSTN